MLGRPCIRRVFPVNQFFDRMINDVLLEQQAESLRVYESVIPNPYNDSRTPHLQNGWSIRPRSLPIPALRRRCRFQRRKLRWIHASWFNAQPLLLPCCYSEFVLQGEIDTQKQAIAQTRDIRNVTLSVADLAKDIELTGRTDRTVLPREPSSLHCPERWCLTLNSSAEALKSQLEVSDEEAQKYYREHLDSNQLEEQRKVSHILCSRRHLKRKLSSS